MKLALSAGALALSMALAGCGGGSSSSGTAQPTIPSTQPNPQQLVSTAEAALADAMRELDGLAANADPAEAARLFAIAERNVRAAANADGHADRQSQLTALQARLRTAQNDFTPEPVVETASSCEAKNQRLHMGACVTECPTGYMDNAAGNQCEAEPKETAADVKGRAVGVFAALNATARAAVKEDKKATISYAHGESQPKITRTGFTAGSAPTSVGTDWAGATLEKTNTVVGVDSKEKIVVYTDIAAPTLKSWASTYGASDAPTTIPGTANSLAPDVTIASGVLTINGTSATNINKNVAKLLDSRYFPVSDGASKSRTYGSASSDQEDTNFRGTFHGVTGTYEFTGTGCDTECTIMARGDGTVNFPADVGLTFTPLSTSSKQVPVADQDYMQFGYWIETPDEADPQNDFNYKVRLIATGGDPFGNTNIAGLATGSGVERKASYKGAAAGIYSNNETHGEFTADATLTATFGDSTDVLSGKISNFKGGADMTGWLVELEEASITARNTQAGVINTEDDPATVKAEMGDAEPHGTSPGTWSAHLWGPETAAQAPSGVTGEFNAEFTNARIVGAFGAKRQP